MGGNNDYDFDMDEPKDKEGNWKKNFISCTISFFIPAKKKKTQNQCHTKF